MSQSHSRVKNFFLARHGETALSGSYCGSTNPPLTLQGRIQGRSAARHLARFPIDICYSSPLRRARETASIIHRQLDVPLITHPLLQELHFGAWEGLRFPDIERRWPELADRWVKDPASVRIPKGEAFSSLQKRVKRFLASVQERLSNQNILIVAHGGSLAAMTLELLGLPIQRFSEHIQPAGSVRMIQGKTLRWIHPAC
jgi:broad specificity phosphatase PhoE